MAMESRQQKDRDDRQWPACDYTRRELLSRLSVLLGGVLSPAVVRAVVEGARTPSRKVLDGEQRAMVRILCERIIPETDTPGAVEAGVPAFVEMMLADWCRPEERERFQEGLAALESFCRKHYGKAFVNCGQREQEEALRDAEKAAAAAKPGGGNPLAFLGMKDAELPFFLQLRELVVIGYYTSPSGARLEHRYNPVPGRYEGEYDLSKSGFRQWSF